MWWLMATLLNLIPHQILQLHYSGEIVSIMYTFEVKRYKVPLPDQVLQLIRATAMQCHAFYVNIQYLDYVTLIKNACYFHTHRYWTPRPEQPWTIVD